MLFARKVEPCCAYCRRGEVLEEGQVACLKKGVVPAGGRCRAFRYDPLKRVPPRPAAPDFGKLKDEDFAL